MEISADVIGLSAHRSPPADGRGKEITILVILASVKGFLYCVHFNLLGFYSSVLRQIVCSFHSGLTKGNALSLPLTRMVYLCCYDIVTSGQTGFLQSCTLSFLI